MIAIFENGQNCETAYCHFRKCMYISETILQFTLLHYLPSGIIRTNKNMAVFSEFTVITNSAYQ